MGETAKDVLRILWLLLFPLLIYLSVVELVFLGFQVFLGPVPEEWALPLTAGAAVVASIPLGLEYRAGRGFRGAGDRAAGAETGNRVARAAVESWTAGSGTGNRAPVVADARNYVAEAVVGTQTLAEGQSHSLAFYAFWPAVLGVGACLFFNGLLMLLPFYNASYGPVRDQIFRPSLPVQLLCMGILIPTAEELVFRGLGYGRLRERLPVSAAAILSALLFGLYHGNWIQGLYAAILGVLLALVYEACGGLLPCIWFHGAANGAAVILTKLYPDWETGTGGAFVAGLSVLGALLLLLSGRMIQKGWKRRETIIHSNTLL